MSAWVWRVALLVFALAAAGTWVGAMLRMAGDPEVLVAAESEVVTFTPARLFDLVEHARPASGFDPDTLQYNALRIRGQPRADDLMRQLDRNAPALDGYAASFERFQVTAGCAVSVEPIGIGSQIRVSVAPAQAVSRPERLPWTGVARRTDPGPCMLLAWLNVREGEDDSLQIRRAPETPPVDLSGKPEGVSVRFQPAFPLRLRGVEVHDLGFLSTGAGRPQSTILQASVRFPKFGDGVDSVYAGNVLTLEGTRGRLNELAIEGSVVRTFFQGDASDVRIAQRSIQPTLLEQIYRSDLVRIFAIAFAATTIVLALAQVVVK